jgi:hypothetical protein
MSPATSTALDVTEDERAELARLREENARLRAQSASPPVPPSPRTRERGWARGIGSTALILVACLLAPLAVTAAWASSQVSDTDRYVETVAPLADDPAIQDAISANITNEIFNRIDVDAYTASALQAVEGQLPPDSAVPLTALSRPLAAGIRSFVGDTVDRVVSSDAFSRAWAEANRAAQAQLEALLSGSDQGALRVEGQSVVVDLSVFAEAIKQRLASRGFALVNRIPDMNTQVVIFESADLPKIQGAYSALNALGLWLAPFCMLLAAIGVVIARNRRRAIIGVGLGVAGAMLLAGVTLAVMRATYLGAVPADRLPPDAAAALFDTMVRFLREVLRAVGLVGLVFAAGAFLTGPARASVRVREASRSVAGKASKGLANSGIRIDGAHRLVGNRTSIWRVGLVVAAAAAFLIPAYPTPLLAVVLTCALLLGLLVVQILATPPAAPPVAEPGAST